MLGTLIGHLPRGRTLPHPIWQARHRGILIVLWLHVPALFVFALVQGESVLHSLFESGAVALFAAGAVAFRGNREQTTLAASLGLLTASAVLVHLSGGVIEMHFHFFVMVGVVTLYQEWRPFIAAIAYVVFQHGVAGALEPGSVYNHAAAVNRPWVWAGIHGLFILGMSAAGIVSWKLNETLIGAVARRQVALEDAQRVASLGSWEWTFETGHIWWSDEMHRLFGVPVAQGPPNFDDFLEHVHQDDRAELVDRHADLVKTGTPIAVGFRTIRPDGETRWFESRAALSTASAPGETLLSGTVLDVTDLKRANTDLHDTLSLLNATLDATADGILVVDGDGVITSFNSRFADMWNLPADVLSARDDNAAISYVLEQVTDPDAFVAKVRELYAQPEAESADVIEFKDGRVFDRYSMPQRVAGDIVGRVWSFRDITERKRLADDLAHQAFHDSLTGLANQVLFRDRTDHALVRAQRSDDQVAVLFIDLDNFKTINDSLGHTAGDQLLVAVAGRLLGSLRVVDTAARLGGDEFAVLLEDLADRDAAVAVAERIIETLRRPFNIAGQDVYSSASIGIAFANRDSDVDQVLRNADLAMYTAKGRGRGRFEVFAPEMHAAAIERLELESDLRRAIERNELVVHYQPIVEVATGQVRSVEALVRWQHPTRGLIAPDSFIALAEESGLIVGLGRHVLRAACLQTRQWQTAPGGNPELNVSVNLSPRQLLHEELVDDVRAALAEAGLSPGSLTLEITEGAMMHDAEAAIGILRSLKRIGIQLAVDDFGTGYSSLSYLQRFPIDIVKIDRSFVDQLDGDFDASALAPAIVRLAQTLSLVAVAEGVETAGQMARLGELGCELAQGFFVSRPQDATAITALFAEPVPVETA